MLTIALLACSPLALRSYFDNLNQHLQNYAKLHLKLNEIRKQYEATGQKEEFYQNCIVNNSFYEMWFPWTLAKVNQELEKAIEKCQQLVL